MAPCCPASGKWPPPPPPTARSTPCTTASPLAGMVGMINMLLGEVVFGGVGAGIYGMMLFVLLTVFLCGLMVGRTPPIWANGSASPR